MQRTGFTVTDRIVNDVQGKNIISRKANIHARTRFSHVELAFLVTRSFGTNIVMFGNMILSVIKGY